MKQKSKQTNTNEPFGAGFLFHDATFAVTGGGQLVKVSAPGWSCPALSPENARKMARIVRNRMDTFTTANRIDHREVSPVTRFCTLLETFADYIETGSPAPSKPVRVCSVDLTKPVHTIAACVVYALEQCKAPITEEDILRDLQAYTIKNCIPPMGIHGDKIPVGFDSKELFVCAMFDAAVGLVDSPAPEKGRAEYTFRKEPVFISAKGSGE